MKTQEIDLFSLSVLLYRKIKSFCCKIVKSIACVITFSLKKFLYILPFLLLGTGLAVFLTLPGKQKYKGEVILHLNDLNAFTAHDMVNSLGSYVLLPEEVAKKMNISPKVAATIIEIRPFFFIDALKDGTPDNVDYKTKFDGRDTSSVVYRSQLCVRFITNNLASFPELEQGILYYFNSNNFLKQQNANRLYQDKELIGFYDAEMSKIDSLRNIEYFEKNQQQLRTLTFSGQTLMLGEKDKQMFQWELKSLQESKFGVETNLNVYSDIVSFISPIKIQSRPVNFFLKELVICLFCSFFVGLFFAFVMHKLEENKQKKQSEQRAGNPS